MRLSWFTIWYNFGRAMAWLMKWNCCFYRCQTTYKNSISYLNLYKTSSTFIFREKSTLCPYEWIKFLSKPAKPHFRAILETFWAHLSWWDIFPKIGLPQLTHFVAKFMPKNNKKLMSQFWYLTFQIDERMNRRTNKAKFMLHFR